MSKRQSRQSIEKEPLQKEFTFERTPWLTDRQVRDVADDDDDFRLDEFFDDDYEYRRRHAKRPYASERQHFDFWD